ncbi:MAG: hypothetical protein KF799_04400 [Bdellovibrionales bacterium]|nr:hypothetical protein [Bdellovibrionales bacterium]
MAASVYAADNCIAAAEMREIARHFTQFEGLAKKGEFCFDDTPTAHLLAGIMFMRKTDFGSTQPVSRDELFSGRFKNDWYGYLVGRISDFQIDQDCPPGVVAYVSFFSTSMYVCPLALTPSFTALDRASVFMHEARHLDGYPHVTCSHGAREGLRGACDTRISDGGSYAVTVETYAQISKYAGGLHPALRAYARSAAIIHAEETFEEPVRIDRTAQFLVLSKDRQFHSLSLNADTVQTKELGSLPGLGRINMRGPYMVQFPDDKTQTAGYVFSRNEGETEQQAGDLVIGYNKSTVAERTEFMEMHSSAQWNAQLMKGSVRFLCDPQNKTPTELALSEEPVGFIYPTGYDRAAYTVQLMSESGRIYDIGCSQRRPFVRASLLAFDQPYRRVLKVGADVIALRKDGRLFRLNGATATPLNTPFDGRVYELVPNQHVEFLDAN